MRWVLTSRRSQPPLALSVPLWRFTSRVGGGSAFYVSHADHPPNENPGRLRCWHFGCVGGAYVAGQLRVLRANRKGTTCGSVDWLPKTASDITYIMNRGGLFPWLCFECSMSSEAVQAFAGTKGWNFTEQKEYSTGLRLALHLPPCGTLMARPWITAPWLSSMKAAREMAVALRRFMTGITEALCSSKLELSWLTRRGSRRRDAATSVFLCACPGAAALFVRPLDTTTA